MSSFAAVRGTRRGRLSSPPLRLGKVFRLAQNVLTFSFGDPVKHFVHSFLNTGIGLVEATSRFRRKLAKHVAVPQSLQGIKYAIRAHFRSFSSMIDFGQTSHHRPQGLMDGLIADSTAIRAGLISGLPDHPNRCSVPPESCSILWGFHTSIGQRFVRKAKRKVIRGTSKYSKRGLGVKSLFQPYSSHKSLIESDLLVVLAVACKVLIPVGRSNPRVEGTHNRTFLRSLIGFLDASLGKPCQTSLQYYTGTDCEDDQRPQEQGRGKQQTPCEMKQNEPSEG